MIPASKRSDQLGFAFAILSVCCLPVPAFSDEFQYLPDRVYAIASVDFAAAAKTKTFQQGMKMFLAAMPREGKEEADFTSKFLRMFARGTESAGMIANSANMERVQVLTAVKSITAAEYKAFKTQPQNIVSKEIKRVYVEIKHGATTIYQETYEESLGKLISGNEAFYVAEDKYVVLAKDSAVLKKIIDRNKAATLSAAMQAGVKDAGSRNIVTAVVDFQNMTAKQKADLAKQYSIFAGIIKTRIDQMQSLTVQINEPDKFKLSATLTCSDRASANAVRDALERSLHEVKVNMEKDAAARQAKEDPKKPVPAEVQKFWTGIRTAINAIRLSSAGNHVTAAVEVEPEIAVAAVGGMFRVTEVHTPSRAKVEVSPRSPPKKDSNK